MASKHLREVEGRVQEKLLVSIGIFLQRECINPLGRVAAAAVAEKFLKLSYGIEIVAFVSAVGSVSMEPLEDYDESKQSWIDSWKSWWKTLRTISREEVDSNEVRCPDLAYADKMRQVL
jgi:chorismate synthase